MSSHSHGRLCVDRIVSQRFCSNTYLLTRNEGHGIVIDPAAEAEQLVTQRMEQRGGRIEYALLTHEHFDHISGLESLRAHWDCEVICSTDCSLSIGDPCRNFSRYLIGQDILCKPAEQTCEDLDWALQWDEIHLRFIPTPGHSPGGVCILVDDLLFSGDTLLPDFKRVVRIPGANKAALDKSLALLLSSCRARTTIYPGHGDPFVLNSIMQDQVQESSLAGDQ